MSEKHPSDEVMSKLLFDVIFKSFYVPDEDLLEPFDKILEGLGEPFNVAAIAFRINMKSAIRSAGLPFLMASVAVSRRRFDNFYAAARIRALKGGKRELDEKDDRHALEIATQQMEEFNRSTEGEIWGRNSVLRDLESYARDEHFSMAAEELLLNTLVTIWGTLEALISDGIRMILNDQPAKAAQLLSHESTRKHFPAKAISIEELTTYEFDVGHTMGDILLKDRHLDSLPVVKDIPGVLFPSNTSLRDRLNREDVWILWQRRHLIVHRRGAIDANYLSRTPDTAPIGGRLKVDGSYIARSFFLAREVATEFIAALKQTPSG